MSSKIKVLSFDDVLNNHKRLLTESLVNFDEGQRVRKIMLDIDSNSADYEYYFQSGQQSKQAEVDELRKRLNMYERDGYKLVPVEPSKEMLISGNEYYSESCSLSGLYKAMIGEETK